MRTFITKHGDAGFALKGDDIVSVFKHPDAPYRNVTRSMLDLAKQEGGKRLDAFDTVLPHIYAQNGFRAVARLPWNETYKPEGWKHETFKNHNGGRPDVVFMAHDPQAGAYNPGDGRMVADYDQGTEAQHAALAHVAARGNVPAAPGPEAYGSGQLIRSSQPTTVWHGTPHVFPPTRANPLGEFNLSKIGAGEGAQAYGHGIYTAGNPKVAEGYRDDLAPGVTYKGERAAFSRTDPHQAAIHAVAEHMSENGHTAEEAIERVRREHRDASAGAMRGLPGQSAAAREANRRRSQFQLGVADAVQRLKPEHFAHNPGQLYEAELHIHPDHMLDWDKPLREQHPYVQNRLHPHMQRAQALGYSTGTDPLAATGEEAHSAIESLTPEFASGGNSKEAAARHLLNAGIPGIRYADQGSRQHIPKLIPAHESVSGKWIVKGQNYAEAGTPFNTEAEARAEMARREAKVSRNYVVFDPRTINVVKHNGLPAMVAAGADALRDHKNTP
jgi:hypothetical protein